MTTTPKRTRSSPITYQSRVSDFVRTTKRHHLPKTTSVPISAKKETTESSLSTTPPPSSPTKIIKLAAHETVSRISVTAKSRNKEKEEEKRLKEEEEVVMLRDALEFHTEGISNVERFLRKFDLNYRFGPCAGITRTERWCRAKKLGLKPPVRVQELLEKYKDREISLFEEEV